MQRLRRLIFSLAFFVTLSCGPAPQDDPPEEPNASHMEGIPVPEDDEPDRSGRPRVIEASPVDGATAQASNTKLVIRFSAPMDRALTQLAYASSSPGLRPDEVDMDWNVEGTELTVTPQQGLDYATVSHEDHEPLEFAFSIGSSARSANGVDLRSKFRSSFSTWKIVEKSLDPDLAHSKFAAYENLIRAPQKMTAQRDECSEYPFAAAPGVLDPTEFENGGVRVGLWFYPLQRLVDDLTEHELAYVRVLNHVHERSDRGWVGAHGLGLDKLISAPFFMAQAIQEPQADDLRTWATDGPLSEVEEFGSYTYEVTELVQADMDGGETYSVFRVGFDGLQATPDLLDVCSSLEFVYGYLAA